MRRTLIAIVTGIVGLTSMAATSQTAQAGIDRRPVPAVQYDHREDVDRNHSQVVDRDFRYHDRDFHHDRDHDFGFRWNFCFWR